MCTWCPLISFYLFINTRGFYCTSPPKILKNIKFILPLNCNFHWVKTRRSCFHIFSWRDAHHQNMSSTSLCARFTAVNKHHLGTFIANLEIWHIYSILQQCSESRKKTVFARCRLLTTAISALVNYWWYVRCVGWLVDVSDLQNWQLHGWFAGKSFFRAVSTVHFSFYHKSDDM